MKRHFGVYSIGLPVVVLIVAIGQTLRGDSFTAIVWLLAFIVGVLSMLAMHQGR